MQYLEVGVQRVLVLPVYVNLLEEWEGWFKAVPRTNVLETIHEFVGGASWFLLWQEILLLT